MADNTLYVANLGDSTTASFISEYDATTGAAIPGFASPTGLHTPMGLAIATPEPSSALLLLGGGLLLARRRNTNSKASYGTL